MAWRIELSELAQKNLSKLDRPVVRRILAFLNERVAPSNNPRAIGQALTGSTLGEFWKYRVGDYRLICRIEDQTITIVVLKIGNRREVYR